MQELQLYEYAIIRLVPRVEREEFINVGVILYCKASSFLDCRYQLDTNRIGCLTDLEALDLAYIKAHLESFTSIAKGELTGHPVSRLDIASRFRWLTAVRSTVIQSSKIHPGRSRDLAASFEQLFNQMVL